MNLEKLPEYEIGEGTTGSTDLGEPHTFWNSEKDGLLWGHGLRNFLRIACLLGELLNAQLGCLKLVPAWILLSHVSLLL